MLAGQKILHRITEAFDANAQLMHSNLQPRPQSVLVQTVSGCPFFQRQMQIHHAPRTHPRSTPRQSPRPLPPLLAIKLIEIFERKLLAHSFAHVDMIEQFDRYRIIGGVGVVVISIAQLLDPLLHHLHVAQLAQRLEKFLPCLLHVLP